MTVNVRRTLHKDVKLLNTIMNIVPYTTHDLLQKDKTLKEGLLYMTTPTVLIMSIIALLADVDLPAISLLLLSVSVS